jgi:hypothetical protein
MTSAAADLSAEARTGGATSDRLAGRLLQLDPRPRSDCHAPMVQKGLQHSHPQILHANGIFRPL